FAAGPPRSRACPAAARPTPASRRDHRERLRPRRRARPRLRRRSRADFSEQTLQLRPPVHGDRTRLACCRARLNAQHPRVACYRFAIELIGATGCMSRSMTLDSLAQRAARILTDAGSAQRIDVALRNAFAQYRRWTAEEKHAIARAVFATG